MKRVSQRRDVPDYRAWIRSNQTGKPYAVFPEERKGDTYATAAASHISQHVPLGFG